MCGAESTTPCFLHSSLLRLFFGDLKVSGEPLLRVSASYTYLGKQSLRLLAYQVQV